MPSEPISYSVVIPVYDSTQSLVELVERLEDVFKNVVQACYEIILIDDASPNTSTWPVMKDLAEHHPEVKIIQLTRNFGKPGAILCGLAEAMGDYIITLDDDLEHRPEDIPRFLEKKDHDVVIGAFVRKQHSVIKRLGSRIKAWFDRKLLGLPAHVRMSPFKLYKAHVVKDMLGIRTAYPFIPALLTYTTRDIVMVDIEHERRKYGKTGFTPRKMVRSFSHLLINNSSLLLRVVSLIGFTTFMISLLLAIYFIIRKMMYGLGIPGWTSLMVVTLIVNGLLLLSIGIVGEYLIRIIRGVENRPPYLVRRRCQQPTQDRNP